ISISAFLFFLDILFGFIEKRTLSKLIPSYKNKMRMTFLGNWFNIIQKRKARLGQINNALQNDIPTVTNMKIESIYSLTYSIVTFVVIISFLFWLHWILGVATLLSLLILGILPLIISKKLEEINFTISKNNEEFYGKSVNINKNKDQYIFTRKLGKYHKSILAHVDNYYLKNIKLTLV
ncbi:ABC transporter transmembrane domain-containing protein, partial [Mycoplasma marinum]